MLRSVLGWWPARWLRWQRWRERVLGLSRPYRLYSKDCQHGLWVRPGTSDLDVFRQIFLEREYSCLEAARDVQLVIDCGANVGYSSAWFLSRFPSCRVIAVEPDEGNYAQLVRNLAPYGNRARTIRSGVWPRPAGLVFSEVPFRDGREWSVQVREARADETPQMTAVDIASLLADAGYPTISVLKIDIEAAERYVFAENYEAWLDAVENLVIELHDDECRQVFFRAIRGRPFKVSQSGELTVCRRTAATRAWRRAA
ncbi:MAG: FkbM family methyltransferase [Planctomycetaceae bacterium]|nr:FkbM family methyltransferase [Planctomycetaceae bacterium]